MRQSLRMMAESAQRGENQRSAIAEWWRDFLLTFCPQSWRKLHRPDSSVRFIRLSFLSGLLQMAVVGRILLFSYGQYMAETTRRYDVLQQQNVTTQGWFAAVFSIAFLLAPHHLFAFYLIVEGFLRCLAALVFAEPVPDLLVIGGMWCARAWDRNSETGTEAGVPDAIQAFGDGDQRRVRVACSRAKPNWNASLTIGFQGQWFEIESQGAGELPRPCIYVLRPAPAGKVLRGYVELTEQAN